MPNYFKSPEGLKAYQKVGLEYTNWVMDEAYEKFKEQWIKHIPKDMKLEQYITHMLRIRDDNKEFIVHDMTEYGYNALRNSHHFYRSELGKYIEPIPNYVQSYNEHGEPETKADSVRDLKTRYSIEFNKDNIERLHRLCRDEQTSVNGGRSKLKTSYYVKDSGGRTISVNSYKDWVEGEYDDLVKWGHVADATWKAQKQKLDEIEKALREKKIKGIADGNATDDSSMYK